MPAYSIVSFVSNSLWPYGPQPARWLCPWDSPVNTGVDYPALLQGIFLTQGLNPHPLYCRGFFTTEPPVNHHYIPYWHEIPSNCQYLIPVFLVMVNIHLFSIRGTCFWKSLGGFCTLYHEGDTVYFLSVLFSCVDGVRKIPTIGEIWFRKKHDRRLRHQSEKKEPRAQSLCIGYKLGTGGTIPVLYTVNCLKI